MKDIANSVNIIKNDPSTELILLNVLVLILVQQSLFIRTMETLKGFNCEVGFSDHTIGATASIVAAALGAKVIEKHFTQSKKLKGPDHLCSLEPSELKDMISAIRLVPSLMGSDYKTLQECEKDTKKVASKIIVAAHKIRIGDVFNTSNLKLIRAGK